MARRGAVFLGLVTGLAVGWFVAEHNMGRHREALFSARPLRRFAALGALAATGGVEAVGLLRDYLEWERHPVLRRRAGTIMRRLESALAN